MLLAPALDFDGNRLSELGDRGLDAWKSSNSLAVFHYGYGRMVPVHYELYADALRYDAVRRPSRLSRPRYFRGNTIRGSIRLPWRGGLPTDRTSSFTCSTMITSC